MVDIPFRTARPTTPKDLAGTIIGNSGERTNYMPEDSGTYTVVDLPAPCFLFSLLRCLLFFVDLKLLKFYATSHIMVLNIFRNQNVALVHFYYGSFTLICVH